MHDFRLTRLISGVILSVYAVCNITACGSGGGSSSAETSSNASGEVDVSLALHTGSIGGRGYADGSGKAARFQFPKEIASDRGDNLYVVDALATIRKISPEGIVSTVYPKSGPVPPVSGFHAIAAANDGTLYVADYSGSILKIDTAGTLTTLLSSSALPSGSSSSSSSSSSGSSSSSSSSSGSGSGRIVIGGSGSIVIASTSSSPSIALSKTRSASIKGPVRNIQQPTALVAEPARLGGMAVDATGNLYVADRLEHTILKILPDGSVSVVAGKTGVRGFNDSNIPADARFNGPESLAFDPAGNLYVTDRGSAVRRISTSGEVTTLPSLSEACTDGSSSPFRVSTDDAGNVFVLRGSVVCRISPAGAVSKIAGGNDDPDAPWGADSMVADAAGNLFIPEANASVIRKIKPSGEVLIFAGALISQGVTDGILAQARFMRPTGIGATADGDLVVADAYSGLIRTISGSGNVRTLAGTAQQLDNIDGIGGSARFGVSYGLSLDSAGNAYVADNAFGSIRRVTPAGVVTTLADQTSQHFLELWGIAVDSTGSVYVSDNIYHAIRKISPAGVVSNFAGNALQSGHVDLNGAAARFNAPRGLAIDHANNIYVADSGNRAIRKISPAGTVSTLVSSAGGLSDNLGGMTVDPAGNLYVIDAGQTVVFKVTPAGDVSALVGVNDGRRVVNTGTLPGHLNSPKFLAVVGKKLFITDEAGVLVADIP